MSTLTITNQLPIYEVNGEEVNIRQEKLLLVKSHWNVAGFVVLEFDGKSVTVDAIALKKAIINATNR